MTISQQGTVGVVGWLAISHRSLPPKLKFPKFRQAKDSYKSDLEFMRRFSLQSGMELVVGEYTLAGQVIFCWEVSWGFNGWCFFSFFRWNLGAHGCSESWFFFSGFLVENYWKVMTRLRQKRKKHKQKQEKAKKQSIRWFNPWAFYRLIGGHFPP